MSETASNAPAHTGRQRVALARGSLELSWAWTTDTGRRRESNQDAAFAGPPLFIVADGMGGHIGGEIASASVIERLGALASTRQVTTRLIEKALAACNGNTSLAAAQLGISRSTLYRKLQHYRDADGRAEGGDGSDGGKP